MDLIVFGGAIVLVRRTSPWIADEPLWPKTLVLYALTAIALYVCDLYRLDKKLGHRDVAARVATTMGAVALLTAAAGFALPPFRFGRFALAQILLSTGVGLVLWRLVWNQVQSNRRLYKRVLVVGLSRAAEAIMALQHTGSLPFIVLGFLDDDPGAPDRLPAGAELLGKTADLLNLVEELQPDCVIVALPNMRGRFPSDDLLECRFRGINVEDWPTFYEKRTGKVLVSDLRPSWLIFADGFARTQVMRRFKRALDLTCALTGLTVALPLMALVALAIKLDSPGPVLFRQRRVGQGGQIFTLNKFRSMRDDAERGSGAVWASSADPRVTRVGRLLRRTRLDELPQLVNVLVGNMSFIGPRPERPEFVRMLRREIPFYMGRLAVKPGVTGWAQVRHHYAASVDDTFEKLQYDLYYIKNLSPFLDILILLNTIQVVLLGRGAR